MIELRQYKMVPGQRDTLVTLFERHFIESQEALGMRVLGQFRDADDADRFTWIRAFDDMQQRREALTAFYTGPVWQAHRNAANTTLDDNDNVLLLCPAEPGSGFGPTAGRAEVDAPPPPAGVIIVTVHFLWKAPAAGFSRFFQDELRSRIDAAGLELLATYVAESAANTFPRLPVRHGEKVFVWIARAKDAATADAALARLQLDGSAWPNQAGGFRAFEERRPQVLRLLPTPRSALR